MNKAVFLKSSRFKPYFSTLIVVLICVFPLFKFEYSTDTYHFALGKGLSGIYGAMEYNCRLVTHYATRLLERISISFIGYYYVSFIMSIIFSTLSITTLYKMLKGHIKEHIAYFLSILTIFNPMVFELFLFIEKGFFAFGIYMSVLAAKYFLSFLDGKKQYLPLSYFFITVSAFTYQPLPGVFVALVLVFIVIYSKSFGEFILNTSLAVTVYGFSVCANYIVMHLLNMTWRLGSGFNFANIYKYLTFGLNIPYFLLAYVFIIAVLAIIVYVNSKKTTGKAFTFSSNLAFLKYLFVFAGTVITTAAPSIVTSPENVWFTLRYSYPIGMLVGTFPILHNYKIAFSTDEKVKIFDKKHIKSTIIILSVLLCLLLLFHAFYFGRHISNYKDKADAIKIGEIIVEYEEKTGIKIENISLYKDKNCKSSFGGIACLPNCNVRALITSWCDVAHLNLLLERDFNKIENDPEYIKYFSGRNWDEITSDQFIFVDNTLHLGVY